MLRDLLRGCWHTVRETLHSTAEEGGAFLSGMVYAFLAHWVLLILVSWSVCSQRGAC